MEVKMSSGWYKTGEEGLDTARRIQEERAAQYGPYRFWLKPGNSAKVTFLDTEGFYFHEHELQINGKWGNYFTCLKDFSECPLCDSGEKPGYVCAYTVIDHSEYESKNGKIKNQKKLLIARPAVINRLARRKETLEGNLTYGLFLFTRDSKDECRTGEDIEFIKRLKAEDLKKFKPKDSKETDEDWLKPFDYMKLFQPKSVEELRKVAGQAPPIGSDDYGKDASPTGAAIPPEAGIASEDSIESYL
jgi:hypothetical protein